MSIEYNFELIGGYYYMAKTIKKITNPLTMISIFAGLAEIAMVTALGLVDPSLQPTFLSFVMGFPILLIVLFFLTLNFNTKVLYAPSDFKDEKFFMESMSSIKIEPKLTEEDKSKIKSISGQVFKNTIVDIDNIEYINCVFENCIIKYCALGSVILTDCSFNGCRWEFAKNASLAINLLSDMYFEFGDWGRKTVELTFENIKNGTYKNR